MEHVWNYCFLIFLASIGSCNTQVTCIKSNKCICHSTPPSAIEIQCPNNTYIAGGFVLHIEKDRKISVDCFPPIRVSQAFNSNLSEVTQLPYVTVDGNKTISLNMNLLPNITVENIYNLEINSCPLPERNFKSIYDKFGLKDVETLNFQSRKFIENITLTEGYFEGLHMLRKLKLNSIGSLELGENVFVNTRNLTSLELQDNNIKLKSNVFQPTLLLKSLDLSENGLKTLPTGLFKNLRNLKALYLRDNELREIHESTFDDLVNLEALDLSLNKFVVISENAFKNLKSLQEIDLSMNKLTFSNLLENEENDEFFLNIPDYLFSNLTSLKKVEITDCKLQYLPEHIFLDSTHIEVLNLTNNLLENFSEILLKGLKNLKELFLKDNKIKNITNMLSFFNNLEKLDLTNNEITTIEENTFVNLKNLKEIYLGKNRITQIHFSAFNRENLNTLQIIDLSHNKISKPYNPPLENMAIFENALSAVDVNLNHNLITRLEDAINLDNKIYLKKLDISHNNITNLTITNILAFGNKLELKLDWNNITVVDFQINIPEIENDRTFRFTYTVLSLTNNPIECTCLNYDLFRYFQNKFSSKLKTSLKIITNQNCFDPHQNKNVSIEKVLPSSVLCSIQQIEPDYDGCPETCGCYWRLHDQSFIVDCSSKNFTTLPNIILPDTNLINYNQTEINFENNSLTEGPRASMVGYSNVTRMILSSNKIRNISWLPPKLQVLKLHNNSLSKLDYKVLQALNTSNFLTLTLNNNPWICDCDAENLTNLVRQQRYVDARYVYCGNTTTPLASMSRKDLCNGVFSVIALILPLMSILLMSATLAALYYRYQQEIKMWLYSKKLCLWLVTTEDLDKDKIYDAFISYSHKDEDFVRKNLVPVLEGKEGYKLCLHYRDFVPGEFISKQVTKSVCESRRTIIVLSANFLESVWGKLEFRTAHTQAMSEGRARVIVILYGEIDTNSLDEEMNLYLKSNTYVKWGDPYFWNKLKYALPHFKKKVSKDKKYENIVKSAQPSLSKNTCALTLSGLKNHPSTFISDSRATPIEVGALLTVTSS